MHHIKSIIKTRSKERKNVSTEKKFEVQFN